MTELNKTEARQGVTLHRMRYVLIFSIAGVLLAFALLLIRWAG